MSINMEEKPFCREELNNRLERVNGWINNCDQKAGILLAFVGALAAVLITSNIVSAGYSYLVKPFYDYWLKDVDSAISVKKLLLIPLLIAVLWNVVKMVKYLVLVLRPKTIIADFKEEDSVITKNSRLHFQSIAGLKYNDFLHACQIQSNESYLNDLCSQIYCNSKICNDKFENYKKGLHSFINMLIYCFIELLFVLLFPQI